ncbi:MAG: hypothetical protein ACE5WD_12425 [Candidatus Aminicenantia bacterium]
MKGYWEYWFDRIKKVLKGKELWIQDLIKNLGEPPATTLRYVNLFVAKNLLKERFENRRKYISLASKKK